VNLAEQQGKEGAVTQAYASYMEALNLKDAQFVILPLFFCRFNPPHSYNAYDFHTETKGMKCDEGILCNYPLTCYADTKILQISSRQ